MATTFKSNVFQGNANLRPIAQNGPEEATITVVIPSGTPLASGDVIKFCKIGENVEITQFELNLDQFDSNATANLDGKLGITADDDCLLASATVLQTNTTGAKTLSGVGGDVATAGGFALNPFPVQTSVQTVILTLTGSAGTAYTTGDRKVTLRFKYQYAYPDTYVTGVTGVSSTNLAGTKVSSQAVAFTYNDNAP